MGLWGSKWIVASLVSSKVLLDLVVTAGDCRLRKTIQGSASEIEGGRGLRGKKNKEHGRTNHIRLERREAG